MRLGNGRWETAKFNTRLQVTELGLGSSATDAGVWKTQYEYGELDAEGNVDASKNTGNIARQTLTVPGTSFVQSYRYDSLYRLTEAAETTGSTTNWSQTWSYDRYGNRIGFAQDIAGNTNAPNPTVDPNTNRFNTGQGFGYDANGNVVSDVDPLTSLPRQFVFNGDNKQSEVKRDGVTIGRYFYDGEGKRVKKETDTETTVFVYSAGKLVAEYSTQLSQSPSIAYTTTDHLGSPRVITNELGQVKARRDFMPFGEELYTGVGGRTGDTGLKYSSNQDDIRQKFTGYQNDKETGLDFAEARMYENRLGRFTAVDPLLASGKSSNPQTFNRYIYVVNSPLIKIDPTGQIMGDYYDRETGRYIGKDDKRDNKLHVGEAEKAKIENGKVVSAEGFITFDTTHSQFQESAQIVKAEAQSSDFDEYLYIAHTGNNNAKERGTYLHTSLKRLSTAPEGSKGLLSTSDNTSSANFSRKAVFDVLLGNPDPTGGATRWDGIDFLAWGLKSPNGTPHNKFEEYGSITIGRDIYMDYANAIRSKYPSGTVRYYGRRYEVPAEVFSTRWRLHAFIYKNTKEPDLPKLTAVAAKGYSIFWRVSK